MAQRVYRFELVSPPGTTPVNNVTDRLEFTPGIVSAITVEIPSGHAGKTGISIWFGFNQVIPLGGVAWMKGNKKTTRYDFDDPFPGNDNWYATHFNRGKRSHTFRLAFEVDDAALAGLLPPVLLLRQTGETITSESPGVPPAPAPVYGSGSGAVAE